jgi:hypothetical protein
MCLSIYTANGTTFDLKVYSSSSQNTVENKQVRDQDGFDFSNHCSKIISEQTGPITKDLEQQKVSKTKHTQKNNLIKSVTESKNEFTDKPNHEIGIWFYANFFDHELPISIIDKLPKFDINTIYLAGSTISDWQNPDKFKSYANFVCYAHSKGLDVYAVTMEDPFFAFEKESEIRKVFANFINSTQGLFKTFMVDVEPHTLHLADPLLFVPKYIKMSLILQQVANHYNVTYVDTVPFWYHSVIKNIGISSGIDILGGNQVNFMDYSYTFNQSITNINRILPEIEKPYTVSIKVTPGYGDPYLNEFELKKTIDHLQNNSIPYSVFESQYLLRNMPDLFER